MKRVDKGSTNTPFDSRRQFNDRESKMNALLVLTKKLLSDDPRFIQMGEAFHLRN
jgi:hypothetical protein